MLVSNKDLHKIWGNHVFMTLALVVILIYCVLGLWQWLRLTHHEVGFTWYFALLSVLALMLHGFLLYRWIDIGGQQNLTVLNLLSMVIWLLGILVIWSSFTRPLYSLVILVFPLAAISVLFASLFPSVNLLNASANITSLIHILLSILTFSVLCMAAALSLVVSLQEYLLRSSHTEGILRSLPPLESMEHFLFQALWMGFLLLTSDLILSFFAFSHLFGAMLIHKTILSLLAWVVFATLLIGRLAFGWRGIKALHLTFLGVFLILICTLFLSIK